MYILPLLCLANLHRYPSNLYLIFLQSIQTAPFFRSVCSAAHLARLHLDQALSRLAIPPGSWYRLSLLCCLSARTLACQLLLLLACTSSFPIFSPNPPLFNPELLISRTIIVKFGIPISQIIEFCDIGKINLMEGLMSARINPIRAYCRQKHNDFTSIIMRRVIGTVCASPFGLVTNSRSVNLVASVSNQSVEALTMGRFDNTLPSKDVLEIWHSADAVCFDVDSTVCVDEGIDELAEFCGAGKAVAEWTTRAMSGSIPFEEALAARLSLFNPSLDQVQNFLAKKPPRISPGIDELVKKLKDSNTSVYLISGGFRQMINPVASILGIPPENIFANQLLFGSSGEFLGFDKDEPTSRSGGKATAVQQIRKAHGYKALVMIGDGATDLEARQPGGAELYICYAGVQLREAVAAKADWLVFGFRDLINSLE